MTPDAKHTPGPWKKDIGGQVYVDGLRIADCGSDDMPDQERHANARLIAASPAMYEALQEVDMAASDTGPHGTFIVPRDVVLAARAALALVEGK